MLGVKFQQRHRRQHIMCRSLIDVRSPAEICNVVRSAAVRYFNADTADQRNCSDMKERNLYNFHAITSSPWPPPLPSRFGQGPQLRNNSVRFFSKFSTDPNEAVAQDSGNSHPTTQQIPSNTPSPSHLSMLNEEASDQFPAKPSIDYLKPAQSKMKHLISLKEAYITLKKTCIDAQALLDNNAHATTPDEIVAMADYFMVLVNCVELETSIETIQSLQYDKGLLGGDSVTEDVLAQAVKSMHKLHIIFLRVVESCIPSPTSMAALDQNTPTSTFITSSQSSWNYSSLTTGRAIQVSRRGEELGMPMHRPLYCRMALGIVMTSTLPQRVDPGKWPWEKDDSSEGDEQSSKGEKTVMESGGVKKDSDAPNLVLSGQFQQVKEGLYTPPLTMELLNLCHRAKVALKCSFSPSMSLNVQMEQSRLQHQLEVDMYSEPWLLLLKRKQFEEAMGLLRGWESYSDRTVRGHINLLQMFNEHTILKALEIAKSWVIGSTFGDEVLSNPHANELISLLQVSLSQILRRRKMEAGRLSHAINAFLAVQATANAIEDNEFDDHESDSDFDSDSDDFELEAEFDSDSEDDEEDDEESRAIDAILSRSEEMVNDPSTTVTRENFPLLLKGVPIGKAYDTKSDTGKEKAASDDSNVQITVSVDDTDVHAAQHNSTNSTEEEDDDDESPIINGMSNKEVRKSIYLRKGPEWELPDVVSQLEDWNKGKPLKFSLEFERYLGWQMSKDDDNDDWI